MTTEIWKDIEGYEGKYQISNLGIIKNHSGFIKKQRISYHGYYIVGLYSSGIFKTISVHRIIAKAFIPNPNNKPHINHIDGNRANNSINNLEWCTPSENQIHKWKVLGYKHPQHQIESLRISGKRIGKMSRRNKHISQFKKDGTFVKEWDSLFVAGSTLKISVGNISSCCTGRYKTAGGFIWKYS